MAKDIQMANVVYDDFPLWFITVESISSVILLILTIITIPLYIFEINTIFNNRNTIFQGPFYRLMFIGMIVDVLSAINIFTGQIIPAKKLFSDFYLDNEHVLGVIFYVVTYGGRCVQGATATLLAFCRVCALCFPILYRKLNERMYVIGMQLAQSIGAIVAVLMLLPRDYKYYFENGGYYSSFDDLSFRNRFYTLVAILELFFVVCIVVFNITLLIAFRFRYKPMSSTFNSGAQLDNRHTREKQKQEKNLTKMTFIVCSVEIIYFIFVVYTLQINTRINKRIFYLFYNILCVTYSTFSAWMLLIFSRPITLQFAQFLRIIRRSNSTQPLQSTSNNMMNINNNREKRMSLALNAASY